MYKKKTACPRTGTGDQWSWHPNEFFENDPAESVLECGLPQGQPLYIHLTFTLNSRTNRINWILTKCIPFRPLCQFKSLMVRKHRSNMWYCHKMCQNPGGALRGWSDSFRWDPIAAGSWLEGTSRQWSLGGSTTYLPHSVGHESGLVLCSILSNICVSVSFYVFLQVWWIQGSIAWVFNKNTLNLQRWKLAISNVHIDVLPKELGKKARILLIPEGYAIYVKLDSKTSIGKIRLLSRMYVFSCVCVYAQRFSYRTQSFYPKHSKTNDEYLQTLRIAGEKLIRQSYREENPPPWQDEPIWTQLLMQDEGWNGKCRFFRPDIWHVVHMGLGKDFAASSMVLLTRILPHGNVDGRFEFFSQEYLSWCKQFHKVKYVNKIDKRSVGGAGVRDEPYGSWNKAALTVTILEFIEYFCNMHKDQLLHAEDVRLRYVCAAVKALNVFMQTLYRNELWIESRKARELAALGTRFVKIYCYRSFTFSTRPLYGWISNHPKPTSAWTAYQSRVAWTKTSWGGWPLSQGQSFHVWCHKGPLNALWPKYNLHGQSRGRKSKSERCEVGMGWNVQRFCMKICT